MKDTLHCTIFWWGQIPTCNMWWTNMQRKRWRPSFYRNQVQSAALSECFKQSSMAIWIWQQSDFDLSNFTILHPKSGGYYWTQSSCVLRRAKTSHEKPFFKAFSFELYMWNTCNPTVLFILALQGYPICHNFCGFTDALRVEPSLVKPRTGFQNIKMKTCGNLMTLRCRIG